MLPPRSEEKDQLPAVALMIESRGEDGKPLDIDEELDKSKSTSHGFLKFGLEQNSLPLPQVLVKAFQDHVMLNHYPQVQGMEETREVIARFYRTHYQLDFEAERLLITPGSKAALYALFSVLEGPLLLPYSSWLSYAPQAKILHKKVVWVPTKPEEAWKIRPDELEASVRGMDRDKQKILALSSPHNPTGHVYTKGELADLAEVCKRHNILVIFDTIYGFPRDFSGAKYCTMRDVYPEGSILTSGMSKIFNAAGWRFGFIALPNKSRFEPVKKALIHQLNEMFIGVCLPVQKAAEVAYGGSLEMELSMQCTQQAFHIATGYVYRRLVGLGVRCSQPMGSFYLFPDFAPFAEKLRRLGLNSSSDLSRLLQEKKLFTLPGELFGVPKDAYAFRVSCIDFEGQKVWDVLTQARHEGLTEASADKLADEHMPRLKAFVDVLEGWMEEWV